MRILTVENESYELDYVPEEIEDIRYCVLDYSDKNNADYIFVPLVFLESFSCPAAILKIGNNLVKAPLDWSLIVCDPGVVDPEVLPITSLNDRGFKTFVFNPITGFMPEFIEVEKLIPLDDFNNDNYEFIGNFTINDNEEKFNVDVDKMCCGIFTAEYVLESGKKIFFGFDYGH